MKKQLNLKYFVETTLSAHAQLVSSGLSSKEALEIVSAPIQWDNLSLILDTLSVDQIDALIEEIKEKHFTYEFDSYSINGITRFDGAWNFELVSFSQLDSFALRVEELTGDMIESINKGIREIL